MQTIQMTLDDDLAKSLDKVVKELRTTRSGFARDALRDAISRFDGSRLEQEHRRGYELYPVNKAEFNVWEDEQDWGDA